MLINNLNNIKHVLTVPHEEKPAFGVDIIFTTSPVKVDGKEEYHLWIKPSLVHLKKYEDFNHHVHVGNFFKNYIKSQNKSLWWNSLHVKKLSVSININNKIYKNAVFDTTNPRFSPLIDLNKNYKNNSFKRYSFDAKNFYKKDINTIRLQTKLESWNYYDYNLFSNQSLSFVNNDFNVIDKKVEYIHMIKIIMFQDYRSKNYLISPKKMNVMSSILSTAIKFKDKLQIKNNKVIKLFEANYFIFENLKNYIEEKNLDFYKSSFINFKGDISKMNGENIINHDNIQRNIKIIFKKNYFAKSSSYFVESYDGVFDSDIFLTTNTKTYNDKKFYGLVFEPKRSEKLFYYTLKNSKKNINFIFKFNIQNFDLNIKLMENFKIEDLNNKNLYYCKYIINAEIKTYIVYNRHNFTLNTFEKDFLHETNM